MIRKALALSTLALPLLTACQSTQDFMTSMQPKAFAAAEGQR
jgi:hypothetical protein